MATPMGVALLLATVTACITTLIDETNDVIYRLVVDLPTTGGRDVLVVRQQQCPLRAISDFAREHSLGLEARELLADHLCSQPTVRCGHAVASAVGAGGSLAVAPVSCLPSIPC